MNADLYPALFMRPGSSRNHAEEPPPHLEPRLGVPPDEGTMFGRPGLTPSQLVFN
jgi:hypothetical protein